MWELDHKESWALQNWCFRIVLENSLDNPLDSKKIKPVNQPWSNPAPTKPVNQPWIFIEKTDAEAETPILWPPDAKSRLIGKNPDSGKDWGQKKGAAEDEMVR